MDTFLLLLLIFAALLGVVGLSSRLARTDFRTWMARGALAAVLLLLELAFTDVGRSLGYRVTTATPVFALIGLAAIAYAAALWLEWTVKTFLRR